MCPMLSLTGQMKGSQRAGWHWPSTRDVMASRLGLFALPTYGKPDLSSNNVQSRLQYCCYLTKENKGPHTGKKKWKEKAQQWRHDLSYSRQQGGNVLLICSMTSVRSALVSWGGASSSSATVPADTRNNGRSQINVPSSTKTQLQRGKCQHWPLNISVKTVSLQRIILGENSKIIFALISGNRILHN